MVCFKKLLRCVLCASLIATAPGAGVLPAWARLKTDAQARAFKPQVEVAAARPAGVSALPHPGNFSQLDAGALVLRSGPMRMAPPRGVLGDVLRHPVSRKNGKAPAVRLIQDGFGGRGLGATFSSVHQASDFFQEPGSLRGPAESLAAYQAGLRHFDGGSDGSGFGGGAAPAGARLQNRPHAIQWVPVTIEVTLPNAEDAPRRLQEVLQELRARGFDLTEEDGERAVGNGVFLLSGVMPEDQIQVVGVEISAVTGLVNSADAEQQEALGFQPATTSGQGSGGPESAGGNTWNSLMNERQRLAQDISDLRKSRQALNVQFHAGIERNEYQQAAHTSELIKQAESRLKDLEKSLEKLNADLRAYRVELANHAQDVIALVQDGPSETVSPFAWKFPDQLGGGAGGAAAEPQPEASDFLVRGIPARTWRWFYAHGFRLQLDKEEAEKGGRSVVKVFGRWTRQEIDVQGRELELSVTDKGEWSASRKGRALTREELWHWLEIAETRASEIPEIAQTLSKSLDPQEWLKDSEEAVREGQKLYSWGVPPHILNNSQDVVTVIEPDGRKHRISMTPDAVFYTFRQGMPVATPTGVLLVQFLEKLHLDNTMESKSKQWFRKGRIRRVKDLTALELQALAFILERQAFPWHSYKPDQTVEMLNALSILLREGRLVGPISRESVGIHLGNPLFDLRGYLVQNFNKLQADLEAALKTDTAELRDLLDLAQAVRFAWTQLSDLGGSEAALAEIGDGSEEDDFKAITHRDGLSFLKLTRWEKENWIWRLMPLGETVLYLKLNVLLKKAVENKIQGRPLLVADAGLADVFHPDLMNVRIIDRSGKDIDVSEFFPSGGQIASLLQAKLKEGESESEGNSKAKPAGFLDDILSSALEKLSSTILPGPILRPPSVLRIDSHATAVVGIMTLAAEAMNTYVVSVDLPGFEGDEDLIPPGVDSTQFFYDQAKLAITAAVEKHGVTIANFSFGAPWDGLFQKFLDAVAAQWRMIFTNAAGNSGPGVPSQAHTPSFSDSNLVVAAEDQLGWRSSFTSAIGFIETVLGHLRSAPTFSTPGGLVGANSRLPGVRIPQIVEASILYLFQKLGDWVHIRGTSFSDPIACASTQLLRGIADWSVENALKKQGVPPEEARALVSANGGLIDQLVLGSLVQTAQPLPGVPFYYSGAGRVQLVDAMHLIEGNIQGMSGGSGDAQPLNLKPAQTVQERIKKIVANLRPSVRIFFGGRSKR